MITIPAKIKDRLTQGVKKYQPIVCKALAKDINESDTVTIVADMLADMFGYDKFDEITSEFAVKKTFCDLAIKLDGTVRLLIEIKAAGLNLKDQYIKQAVDYGANSGVEWVILTNSVEWMIYKVVFAKPITTELVYEIDMRSISAKKQADLEFLYYLTREAMSKSSKVSLEDYHLQKQLLSRFMVAQIILSDPVLDVVRKMIKKISADAKVSNEEIFDVLINEVIKRDALDDDRSADAKKKLAKALRQPKQTVKKEING